MGELAGDLENATPRSPMKGVAPAASTEAPQQRSPNLVARQGQVTVNSGSPNGIPLEIKFSKKTKLGSLEEVPDYDIALSPMKCTTPSQDKANVEVMNVNQFV